MRSQYTTQERFYGQFDKLSLIRLINFYQHLKSHVWFIVLVFFIVYCFTVLMITILINDWGDLCW